MQHCPECGQNVAANHKVNPQPLTWRDVARVDSVAEAGYLATLFEEVDIEVESAPAENFNAASGAWATAHVVRVPEDQVSEALEVLRLEAANRSARKNSNDEQDIFEPDIQKPATKSWVPLAVFITLILATAALLGMDALIATFGREPEAKVLPISSLPKSLREISEPFYASSGAKSPLYRLSYNNLDQTFELAVDSDRDGRFDLRSYYGRPVAGNAGAQ